MIVRKLLFCWLVTVPEIAFGIDHSAALKEYLTDDVAAVAYVNLSKVDVKAILQWCGDLGVVPKEVLENVERLEPMVQRVFNSYESLGVSHAYALFRVSDVNHKGVTWVVPVAEGGDPKGVMGMILSGRPNKFHVEHDTRPPFLPLKCEVVGNCVLGAMNEAQLELLKTKRPTTQRDLSEAWKALGDGHVGLILFGDADSRRVVRQLFPNLPAPFDKIDGKLIADGLKWGGVSVYLPPEPKFELLIDTSAENIAETVDKAIQELWSLVQDLPQEKILMEQKLRELILDDLKPRVDGKRVRISLEDVAAIASLMRPPIEEARQSALRNQRIRQFKWLGLAFQNYADRQKTFPSSGTISEDGKPLLSWRVLILPEVERQDLYDRFRLHEPWNSEHNLKLVKEIPDIYVDPALPGLKPSGKTTYMMPVGEGTIGGVDRPVSFRQITDGTSNTIMLVEVNPDNAVIWTRPDDWQVNLQKPYMGIRRDDREWFTTGFCDGHARVFHIGKDSIDNFRACLTISGGEVIEW